MTNINLLEDLHELAIRAHSLTSHVPAERGEQIIKEYSRHFLNHNVPRQCQFNFTVTLPMAEASSGRDSKIHLRSARTRLDSIRGRF